MTVTVVDAGPRKVSRAAEVHAPARELFAIVADPRRHGELDGSGTVHDTVSGPARLSAGARFSVKMTWYGVPYRITSRVTGFTEDRVVEWQHPLGHRWRWELAPLEEDRTPGDRDLRLLHGRLAGGPRPGDLRRAGAERQGDRGHAAPAPGALAGRLITVP